MVIEERRYQETARERTRLYANSQRKCAKRRRYERHENRLHITVSKVSTL